MQYHNFHAHSEYSILDGLGKVKDIVEHSQKLGNSSVCITDHGNMSAHIELYNQTKNKNIQPIYGMEVYCWQNQEILLSTKSASLTKAKDKNDDDSFSTKALHYVLIALNKNGYKNLLKLNYLSNTDEYFYKTPRLTKELIYEHNSDLLLGTACLQGVLSQMIKNKVSDDVINKEIMEMKNVFDDRLMFEIMSHNDNMQKEINQKLIELSSKHNVKLVISTDSHYLTLSQANAQEILYNIKYNIPFKGVLNKTANMNLSIQNYSGLWNVWQSFNHPYMTKKLFDECIDNSQYFFNMINKEENFINDNKLHFPKYSDDSTNILKNLVMTNFQNFIVKYQLSKKQQRIYFNRLISELDVILSSGYADYFLILYDVLNWGRSNNIRFGISRGSAGGSLTSYMLQITNVDPIKHNLYFERFMGGKGNVRTPDIDVDISSDDKNKLEVYLKEKYGETQVAHVVTYPRFYLKNLIRDLTRIFGKDMKLVNDMIKDIGNYMDYDKTMDDIMSEYGHIPSVRGWLNNNDDILYYIKHIQGNIRHVGKHAAGVVITPEPLYHYIPAIRLKNEIITAYQESSNFKDLQSLGLLKYDLLGVSTVDLIHNTLTELGKDWDYIEKNIDINDPNLYKCLLSEDNHYGCFQLSENIVKLAHKIEIKNFNELVDVISMFRPGFLNSHINGKNPIDIYIQNKHSQNYHNNIHPILEPILKSTYGLILYQEQVMQILHDVGNYSWVDSDKQRKKIEKLNNLNEDEKKQLYHDILSKFQQHSNLKKDEAQKILDYIVLISGYSFNRSHAVGYALLSLYTLFLKTYHFDEFMLNVLDLNTYEKIREYLIPYLLKKHYRIENVNYQKSLPLSWKLDKNNKIFYPPFSFIKGFSHADNLSEILINHNDIKNFQDFIDNDMIKIIGKSNVAKLAKVGGFRCFDDCGKNWNLLSTLILNFKLATKSKKKKLLMEAQSTLNIFDKDLIQQQLKIYHSFFENVNDIELQQSLTLFDQCINEYENYGCILTTMEYNKYWDSQGTFYIHEIKQKSKKYFQLSVLQLDNYNTLRTFSTSRKGLIDQINVNNIYYLEGITIKKANNGKYYENI